MLSNVMAGLEGSIVATALPAMMAELHGIKLMSWVVTIYMLLMAVSSPIWTKLAERFEYKQMFVLGTLLFTIGSLGEGLAINMLMVIVARALMGLGAGVMIQLPFVIYGMMYQADERRRVIGNTVAAYSFSTIAGPIVGGLIVTLLDWRVEFYSKAKDHKLNRLVAVKVLKQEFSENENFVSKFRVEAQSTAGLMHPNIVNVYDVGDEDGVNYIVMELVDGITLKKYIEKKSRLSVKEAVSIAIQVAMGLEAAHNNNIIHRDIKPQNIMISKEGKVKVTDFGIAKAATSNTITSNVMGSVHYTSPEQARGGYSDAKSDIYSLGITLFEMLTGRVPFNGDTTVAIAIKHIQEELPTPAD